MNLFIISGLGADYQAFQKITWPPPYRPIYLPWIEPQPREPLHHYALRMIENQSTTEPFALCGLSFGGIICQEIHKQIPAQKVIIISSIHRSNQLAWYLRLAGKLHLHQLNLLHVLQHLPWLTNWAFGAKQSKHSSYLQHQLQHTSKQYIQWSLHAILHWKQHQKPERLIHIHGSKDKLFPAHYIQADYLLAHGSHFMILTHAAKISEILEKELT